MSLVDKLALVLLGLAWGAQIVRRPLFGRYVRLLYALSIVAVFGSALYLSWSQYRAWASSDIGKFFLPPYQSAWYYVSYVGSRYLAPSLIALVSAFAVSRACFILNRRFGERFFEEEEIPVLAFAVFVTGYPGFLFYIPLMLAAAILLAVAYHLLLRGRAPLYYLWLPIAISAIIVKTNLIPPHVLSFFNL